MKDDDEKASLDKEIATITEHRDDLETQLEGIDAELRDAQSRDGADSEPADRADADGNAALGQEESRGEQGGPSVASLEGERGAVQEGIDRDNKAISSLEKARDSDTGNSQTTMTNESTAQFGARGPAADIQEVSASMDISPSSPPPGGGDRDAGTGGANGGNPPGTGRTEQPTEEAELGRRLVEAHNKVSDGKEGEIRHLGNDTMQMTPHGQEAFGVGNLAQDPVSTVALSAAMTAAVIADKGPAVLEAVKVLDGRSEERVQEAMADHKPSEQNVRDNETLEEIHAEDVGKEQAAREQREAKSAEAAAQSQEAAKESQSDVMAAVECEDAAKWARGKEAKESGPAEENTQGKTDNTPSIGGPDDSKFLSSLKSDTSVPMPEPGIAESKFLSDMGRQASGEMPAPSEPVIEQSNGETAPAVPSPSEPALSQASHDGGDGASPSLPPADQPASQIAANDNHPPPANDNDRDDR